MTRCDCPAVQAAGSAVAATVWAALLVAMLVAAPVPAGQTVIVNPANKPTTLTESCSHHGCHASIRNRPVMHAPAAQDKCLACHAYDRPELHTFTLVKKQPPLCTNCHMLKSRNFVHEPVAKGPCTGCHDPHGSKWRSILIDDPTGGLCLHCHKQEGFSDKKFKHGPVAAGACILCHEPHSSWQPKLLVKKQDPLCRTCHPEVLPEKNNMIRHIHPPVQQGCSVCHDPHASDYRYQLVEQSPALCFGCHPQLKKDLSQAAVVHGALQQPGGCQACHSPHSSFLPKLQRQDQPAMCLTCHDRPLTTPSGRRLEDMASLLRNNPNQHGPIRESGCTTCHHPHAGQQANLLVKAYPPEFYAPYSDERYALCFSCHLPQLVKDPKGQGVTRFRNQNVNLHWLHVNREKGRTCRACHEVHASSHPFHIRDKVPFGKSGWMLEIKYKKTTHGGQCSPGCHETKRYQRDDQTPVPPTSAVTPPVKPISGVPSP